MSIVRTWSNIRTTLTQAQINSQSIPRLDPIDSKSIKFLLISPELMSEPLQSSPTQINSPSNPRLDPINSKSSLNSKYLYSSWYLPVAMAAIIAQLTRYRSWYMELFDNHHPTQNSIFIHVNAATAELSGRGNEKWRMRQTNAFTNCPHLMTILTR